MNRSALCPDRIPTIARQNPAHGLPTSCTGFCRRSVSCLSGSAAAQESAPVPVSHRATRPGFVSFGGFVTGQKPPPVEVYAAVMVFPSARLRKRANRGTLRGPLQGLRWYRRQLGRRPQSRRSWADCVRPSWQGRCACSPVRCGCCAAVPPSHRRLLRSQRWLRRVHTQARARRLRAQPPTWPPFQRTASARLTQDSARSRERIPPFQRQQGRLARTFCEQTGDGMPVGSVLD